VGWNRLAVGPLLGVFPFRTHIAASRIDGASSLVLDFDVPRNPRWCRPTCDELREVAPGVFTGMRLYGRLSQNGLVRC
jgi:hypothetical protein